MEKHETQRREANIRKLVSTARAIISNEIGMPVGCIRASKILYWLKGYDGPDYPIFELYLREVHELPIGHERLEWEPNKLKTKDAILEKYNAQYREKILDACQDIIKKYA